MADVILSDGGTTYATEKGVRLYRAMVIRTGLKLEVRCPGLRLTSKGPSCYSQAKRIFGLRGKKQRVLDQLEDVIEKMKSDVVIERNTA